MRSRWREARRRDFEPLLGNIPDAWKFEQCVNGTGADSNAGTTQAGHMIGKWLNAGVLESGNLTFTETGTPQGGVISPLLANIYLHYVLDEWFAKEVKPLMRGQSCQIRYADDFVIIFREEKDAERVKEVIPKRIGKYGLTLHPEKTKLLDFRSPCHYERRRKKEAGGNNSWGGKPETFDLPGFTHYSNDIHCPFLRLSIAFINDGQEACSEAKS